jgi:hypothetical protein
MCFGSLDHLHEPSQAQQRITGLRTYRTRFPTLREWRTNVDPKQDGIVPFTNTRVFVEPRDA